MIIDFTGKRVLVTGSTTGIGFAAAKGFLAANASVVIGGRSEARVTDAIGRLAEFRPRVSGFTGDLATADACSRLIAEHPKFDILVNNLGIYRDQDFYTTPDSDWENIFQTNVMSGVRLARAYAPHMVERGWGRIVFVTSESAINVPAEMIPYGFTKSGLLAISRGLAKRLAGTGVTVNAVLPGPTWSEGVAAIRQKEAERDGKSLDQAAADYMATNHPSSIIERFASADEVANIILYASSEQAAATTGAALRVDGGKLESIP